MEFKLSRIFPSFRYFNDDYPGMYCDCMYDPEFGDANLYVVKELDSEPFEVVYKDDINCHEDDLENYILEFMKKCK